MNTTNDKMMELELPPDFLQSCMRQQGWDQTFAEKAILGYRQFIKLKLKKKDWHATRLSPSSVIDLVWHDHILHVEQYVQACQSYAGHLIGHNPNGALNVNARAARIEATLRHLRYYFNSESQQDSVDAEIWSYGAYFEFALVHPSEGS